MAVQKTLMTGYSTLEYKDKVASEQKAALERLLDSLPEYVREYAEYKEPKLSIKTCREYIQDLYSFFCFIVDVIPDYQDSTTNDVPLEALSSLSLNDFGKYEHWLMRDDRGGGYNSPTTIKRKKSSLRSFYNYLYASDRISVNPVAKIESSRNERKPREDIRVLTNEERVPFLAEFDKNYDLAVKRLNEATVLAQEKGKKVAEAIRMKPAITKRDKAIIYLFLGSGLRVSELCAINCADYVPSLKRINVIRKGEGQNKKKTRTDYVLLSDEVVYVLDEYIKEFRDTIGPDINNYDALFLSSKHTRLTPRAIEQMVEKYANATLGTNSGIHPHVLRASFGFRYQEQYGDILATSEVMNHSSVDVTAQHYLRRKEDSKIAAQNISIT